MSKVIQSDIQPNAQFKIRSGSIFIINSITDTIINDKTVTLVRSQLSDGKPNTYCDSISEVVAFFNEQNAVKL